MGALEEAAKATGGFIETMRSQPLVLMMGLMNIGLLLFLFYYLSRITARTENTVAALFNANDKLYAQWGTVIKDTQGLTEKAMHCILPEDALKLLALPPRGESPPMPAPPAGPAPLQRPKVPEPFVGPRDPRAELNVDPPKPSPVEEPSKPVHIDVPPPPVEAEPKPAE
jgi:hypothetical protein